MRAMFELRKVVNAVIREHGKPMRIVVELSREMHGGKEARQERSQKMREREKDRDRIKAEIERLNKPPTRANIEKYLLWEEQNGTCPYTGKPIGVNQIFQRRNPDRPHLSAVAERRRLADEQSAQLRRGEPHQGRPHAAWLAWWHRRRSAHAYRFGKHA